MYLKDHHGKTSKYLYMGVHLNLNQSNIIEYPRSPKESVEFLKQCATPIYSKKNQTVIGRGQLEIIYYP